MPTLAASFRKWLKKPQALTINNPGTGTGGIGDNSIERVYRGNLVEYEEECQRLNEIYPTDAILQQIMSVPINDSLSEWRKVSESLRAEESRLSIRRVFMEAGIEARKRGTALIMPILTNRTGGKLPLNSTLDTATQAGVVITRLAVVSNFEPDQRLVKDSTSERHGQPVRYRINDVWVHGSRVLPIYGTQGKTSAFAAVEQYLADWHLGKQDVSRAVQEANFLAMGSNFEVMRDIVDAQNITEENGVTLDHYVRKRARDLKCNANNNNAYIYDKENEELVNIAKANIGDMVTAVDQMGQHLAGAGDIPVSRLLARVATGLANSSQVDIQNYTQALKGYRFMVLEPRIHELDKFLKLFDANLEIPTEITWNPLAIEGYLTDKAEPVMETA